MFKFYEETFNVGEINKRFAHHSPTTPFQIRKERSTMSNSMVNIKQFDH
jgi:hypothetical protein